MKFFMLNVSVSDVAASVREDVFIPTKKTSESARRQHNRENQMRQKANESDVNKQKQKLLSLKTRRIKQSRFRENVVMDPNPNPRKIKYVSKSKKMSNIWRYLNNCS